jgi:hypothetical protein
MRKSQEQLNSSAFMKPPAIFFSSFLAAVTVLLVGWRKDPAYASFPRPATAVVLATISFVVASALLFLANILLALSKGKNAKNEEELEAMIAPALRGQEYDEQILRWTVYPRAIVSGLSLGAVCAVAIHHFLN